MPSAAGTSQTDANTLGLNDWTYYNGGVGKWYVGNIKTCSDKGMRLPTVFETTTTTTTHTYYPTDAAPLFAGASNGVPNHASGHTWMATANTASFHYYFTWSGAVLSVGAYNKTYYVRCVLP